jgi:hypothetical protein
MHGCERSGRGRRPGRLRSALSAGFLLAVSACQVTQPYILTPDRVPDAGEPGPLKVHLHSGEVVVMTSWRENVEQRRLTGLGTRYDADRSSGEGPVPVDLPVDSVALLEIHRSSADIGKGVGLTLLASYTVLTGGISFICAMDPKSCFGSCPTFYVDENAGEEADRTTPVERLVAEGFSSSVARALEATDMDDLRVRAAPGPFSLRMRNEALETHAVRSLRLHAVVEPEGKRALATPTGSFRLARQMIEPVRCTAPEGDCLAQVRARDGRERKSLTDPEDLARRETLELEFTLPASDPVPEGAPGDGVQARFGLALAARHSFVSTFLFYQTLGYLGRDAAALLAGMERGDAALVTQVRELLDMPGRLEVAWMDAEGDWHPAGAYVEAGPLATDLQLIELPEIPAEGPLRIRLELTQGFWRLEYAALAELGEVPASVALHPARVAAVGPTRIPGSDAATPLAGEAAPLPGSALETPAPGALAALLDPERHLVTEPGDHYRIEFDLPPWADGASDLASDAASDTGAHPRAARPARDAPPAPPGYRLFLESTGYYYEWMRSEWMDDESPGRVATLFLDPERAFRDLAPAFKKLEPVMEEAFWASRFRR